MSLQILYKHGFNIAKSFQNGRNRENFRMNLTQQFFYHEEFTHVFPKNSYVCYKPIQLYTNRVVHYLYTQWLKFSLKVYPCFFTQLTPWHRVLIASQASLAVFLSTSMSKIPSVTLSKSWPRQLCPFFIQKLNLHHSVLPPSKFHVQAKRLSSWRPKLYNYF